jgi:hypothetical protein
MTDYLLAHNLLALAIVFADARHKSCANGKQLLIAGAARGRFLSPSLGIVNLSKDREKWPPFVAL